MKVIKGDKVIYKFTNEMDYIEKVKPGEVIKIHTNDCFFQQIKDESQSFDDLDFSKVNPATGPIYVEGAEPGDILKVKILSIDIGNEGVGGVLAGGGTLGDLAKKSKIRIIPIEDGFAKLGDIKLPINPMIGVIGVAPAKEDGEWETNTPWKHGGNMDTNDIVAGSTLYFPVNQEGGLLALGDCHGMMGDGEVSMVGLEIPAKVILEVDIIKNKSITWPILANDKETMIIGSGDTIEEALYESMNQAVKFLEKGLNIDWEDAYILGSIAVDAKISQAVNPKKTVRASIPKHLLSTEKLIKSI